MLFAWDCAIQSSPCVRWVRTWGYRVTAGVPVWGAFLPGWVGSGRVWEDYTPLPTIGVDQERGSEFNTVSCIFFWGQESSWRWVIHDQQSVMKQLKSFNLTWFKWLNLSKINHGSCDPTTCSAAQPWAWPLRSETLGMWAESIRCGRFLVFQLPLPRNTWHF